MNKCCVVFSPSLMLWDLHEQFRNTNYDVKNTLCLDHCVWIRFHIHIYKPVWICKHAELLILADEFIGEALYSLIVAIVVAGPYTYRRESYMYIVVKFCLSRNWPWITKRFWASFMCLAKLMGLPLKYPAGFSLGVAVVISTACNKTTWATHTSYWYEFRAMPHPCISLDK